MCAYHHQIKILRVQNVRMYAGQARVIDVYLDILLWRFTSAILCEYDSLWEKLEPVRGPDTFMRLRMSFLASKSSSRERMVPIAHRAAAAAHLCACVSYVSHFAHSFDNNFLLETAILLIQMRRNK